MARAGPALPFSMKSARDNYGPSSSSSRNPHNRTGTISLRHQQTHSARDRKPSGKTRGEECLPSGMSQRPAPASTITTRVPTNQQPARVARISPAILQQRPYPLPATPALGPANAPRRPAHKLSPLGLGVNEHTGRVQWCPGFTCHKLFVLIPVVMLPLALVLILLMRMDSMLWALRLPGDGSGMAPSEQLASQLDYDYGIEDAKEPTREELRLVEELKRCMALRLASNEELDEHNIMKDVKTSFRPPDDVVQMPRECLHVLDLEEQKDLNVFEEADDKSLRRRPRRTPFKQSEREATKTADAAEISLELEEKDVSGVYEDSATFQSFWNAHGTREALRTAQGRVMKRYMDTSVDPCVDFYKYACGNWERLHPIPKDKAGFDTFEMLRESLDLVLKQLLESNEPSTAGVAATKVKEVKSNQFHAAQPAGGNADLTKSAPVEGNADSANDSKREMLDEKAARLRRHIVQHRRDLSRILLRFKRQNTNSKRKRLVAFNPQLGRSKLNATPSPMAQHARQKAKFLYQSCINSELLARRGIEPLLKLIDSLGGWPVLDAEWSEDQFDWLNLTATLRQYNNDILIVQWVGPDIKNSDENIIQFDQTSLGLPTREYYLQEVNAKYLHAYQVYMGEVMQKLGAPQELAKLTAQQLITFETQLASITSPAEQRLNVTKLYKRLSLRELHESVPAIDWTRYLSLLQQRRVHYDEQVVIYATDYMNDLVNLLSLTERRTVANYLMWRFVRHRISNVDDRFEQIKQNFYHTLFGREESPSRWKVCISQVNTNMGMALGSMFVQQYFDEGSKADTLSMTHELQQSFRDILHTTGWLDEETKRLAEEKVNAMSLKIGYPDFILNEAELDEKYAGIEIHPDKYFENTLNVLLHTAHTEQRKLFEPVNKTTWQTAPAIVNAYYSRNKNQIMFPAGILQPPFYHRHFPRSLNFGGIGVVIGHELTHGFDDKGRLFDRNGNIHKWWTNSAIAGFDERARCIIDQYNNYTVGEVGISLNGESTQGENIADNGGIRQAFHAYKRWLSDNPSAAADERLPGLNMTGEQLFFLNFGQVWCGAMRPEAVRNKLNTAIHSPGRFRVIGTVSNSEDFAREFRCPVDSPMNPERKCAVW